MQEERIKELKELVQQGKRIVLWGTGSGGFFLHHILAEENQLPIDCFCDNNCEKQLRKFKGKDVISFPEMFSNYANDVIILATIRGDYIREMRTELHANAYKGIVFILDDFIKKDVQSNREFCGYFHKTGMDRYFRKAEMKENLNIFWGGGSPFYALFQKMKLENVVELACGRGRHVPQYIDESKYVVLVDILKENIEYCKHRFKGDPRISYYQNNGYDLSELRDNTYTALFTYDAMVHFEAMDIYSYIKETYRILQPGGCALFHHSNNDLNYRAAFSNGTAGRAFMSKNLFAYFSWKEGFEILEQKIIDWSGVKNLDCITLLQKK